MNPTISNSNTANVDLSQPLESFVAVLTRGSNTLVRDTNPNFNLGVQRMCSVVDIAPITQEIIYSNISSFSPEPYNLKSPIKIKVVGNDPEYIASHYESNIHASGDTPFEAIENLKSVMLDTFDSLTSEPEENLGLKAKHQRALLQSIIERE